MINCGQGLNCLKLDLIILKALGFFSIAAAFINPLDNASSPIIPEPANISRKEDSSKFNID